tara:strand:+ start:1584 stop:1763 length:180 start_codon:yes stop_codon:yes gene_type:complete
LDKLKMVDNIKEILERVVFIEGMLSGEHGDVLTDEVISSFNEEIIELKEKINSLLLEEK